VLVACPLLRREHVALGHEPRDRHGGILFPMKAPVADQARSILSKVASRLPSGHDEVTGLRLPPFTLRAGGQHFRKNADFLASAAREVGVLVDVGALGPDTRVLDVGCGAGRLAFGLIARFGDEVSYRGVDVMPQPIDWCKRHISTSHPGYAFLRIDVSNDRYNPNGTLAASTTRLPFESAEFDLVYAYSVLSHMDGVDVAAYLREFRRVMSPGGRAVVTAFVESGVDDEVVNPPGYGPITWSGELHCVRFSVQRFEEFVREAGLLIERLDHRTETEGQSRLILAVAER
jgi:SAM-dependent methyltransferase